MPVFDNVKARPGLLANTSELAVSIVKERLQHMSRCYMLCRLRNANVCSRLEHVTLAMR